MSTRLALLAPWVRNVADLLGLRDWEIDLLCEPCDESMDAHIEMMPGQRRALVALSPRWPEESPEDRRHTIAHELVHCHFHEAQAVVERTGRILGMVGELMLCVEHKNFLEHGVDAMALAVAPYLPLPPDEGGDDGGLEERGTEEGTVRCPRIQEQDGQAGVPDRDPG